MTDTTPALDDVGAALAARLQARAASRGVGTAPRDPTSRAWARTRDDSGAPGASPRRARLLSRVMEGFGTALPAWDRWGQGRGATVLRVLGEAYVLSPDGFVWVVPQAEDTPEEASVVSGWTRAPRRRGGAVASAGRPSSSRAVPGATPRGAVDREPPVLLQAPTEPSERADAPGLALSAVAEAPEDTPTRAPSRTRRRGRAVARAAARAVPSRGVGRARPASIGAGRARPRGAVTPEEGSAGWAPIAAAFARLDAPETVRRALSAAVEPVTLAGAPGLNEPNEVRRPARWGTPTRPSASDSGVLRARGESAGPTTRARRAAAAAQDPQATFELAQQASAQAVQAAARPLARAARRSEAELAPEYGVTSRSIVPRALGLRGALGGLATPRSRPSRATDVALIGLDGPGVAGEAGTVAASGALPAAGVRLRGVESGARARPAPSTAASAPAPAGPRSVLRGPQAVEGVEAEGGPEGSPASATARVLARATRADAARAAEAASAPTSTSLAAPPMSWIHPVSGTPSPGAPAGSTVAAARPGPVGHAQRRAAAGPRSGFAAPIGAPAAPAGAAPDAFADAVRARHEALSVVRSASRSLAAPEAVLLDGGASGADPRPLDAASSDGGSPVDSTAPRRARGARPTTRLRDRGASPEERRSAASPQGPDVPEMTLAAAVASQAQTATDVLQAPPAAARGGHVGIAAWRRALSSAPKDVASALASSPELGAKVVAAMRQMKALPADEATPLHARTAPPAGVAAPSQQQEARREKTAAALATLRGSPMRTRADRPNQTRLTRLASKLEGLVHLVESEQREAEAQRWVRRASEPAEAAGASTAPAAAGAQDMSLDTLQREVLEAVLRELERAQARGEGIGHANADW